MPLMKITDELVDAAMERVNATFKSDSPDVTQDIAICSWCWPGKKIFLFKQKTTGRKWCPCCGRVTGVSQVKEAS
jgi:hypothetical protein